MLLCTLTNGIRDVDSYTGDFFNNLFTEFIVIFISSKLKATHVYQHCTCTCISTVHVHVSVLCMYMYQYCTCTRTVLILIALSMDLHVAQSSPTSK